MRSYTHIARVSIDPHAMTSLPSYLGNSCRIEYSMRGTFVYFSVIRCRCHFWFMEQYGWFNGAQA